MTRSAKKAEPFWLEEKDWLVYCITVELNDQESRTTWAHVIGRLLGYAMLTNTRCAAEIGAASMITTYQLLFSFDSAEHKREFMAMAQGNEVTRAADWEWVVPTLDEIRDAKPLPEVIPEDMMMRAQIVAMLMLSAHQDHRSAH